MESPEDIARLFAWRMDVPPSRLWWQCGRQGVQPFAAHELVMGAPVSPYSRTDGRDSHAVVAGLRAVLRESGADAVPDVQVAVDALGRCVLPTSWSASRCSTTT